MIYTSEQWKADRAFKAEPGQEIEQAVYESMLNCIPPKELPRKAALMMLGEKELPVHAGFLMGEPNDTDKEGPLYLAFGSNTYSDKTRYYYMGKFHEDPKLNGQYYFLDCMNAFANDGLFPAGEFKDDLEAIRTAANYEATLYKYTFKDGEEIEEKVLYEPRFY